MIWAVGSGINAERAKILTAMQRGISDVPALSEASGVPLKRVQTHLTNMQGQHQVRQSGTHWYPTGQHPLEQHWRGVMPLWRYDGEAA